MNLLILAKHYDHFIRGSGEFLADHYEQVDVVLPKWARHGVVGRTTSFWERVDRPFTTSRPNVSIHPVPHASWCPRRCAATIARGLPASGRVTHVLAHFIVPYGWLGGHLAARLGVPCFCVAHGFDVYRFPFANPLARLLTKRILRRMTGVMTVSSRNRDCLLQLGVPEQRVLVVSNGSDPALFAPRDRAGCRRALGLPADGLIVACVGVFVDIKNHQTLVRAFRGVAEAEPAATLVLVGSGPLEGRLRALAADAGVGG